MNEQDLIMEFSSDENFIVGIGDGNDINITASESTSIALTFSGDEAMAMDTAESEEFDLSMANSDETFNMMHDTSVVIIEGEPYTESYEATSRPDNDYQLNCQNKLMNYNVTIKKIPYEAVSNIQGGDTITIGGY